MDIRPSFPRSPWDLVHRSALRSAQSDLCSAAHTQSILRTSTQSDHRSAGRGPDGTPGPPCGPTAGRDQVCDHREVISAPVASLSPRAPAYAAGGACTLSGGPTAAGPAGHRPGRSGRSGRERRHAPPSRERFQVRERLTGRWYAGPTNKSPGLPAHIARMARTHDSRVRSAGAAEARSKVDPIFACPAIRCARREEAPPFQVQAASPI